MNDDQIVQCLIEIKTQLAEISANQKNFQTVLTNHENRLMSLEGHGKSEKSKEDEDFKTVLLKLLAKCLVIGLCVIASLTGASSLLKQVWSEQTSQVIQQ